MDSPAVKKNTKKEITKEKLRELITDGGYGSGDKLPSERDLAQMLGVSRNLLREAVISLAAEGMLDVRERNGIFVKSFGDFGMVDTLSGLSLLPAEFLVYQLEVRTIITVPAARLAAQRRTDEDIRKLKECYEAFISCPYQSEQDEIQSGKWESLLHHLTTEAAHNPVLSRVNESINTLVEKNNSMLHPYLLHEEGWMSHIQKQHADIIRAIEERDSKTAGDVLKLHMAESVNMMREKFPNLMANIASPVWNFEGV